MSFKHRSVFTLKIQLGLFVNPETPLIIMAKGASTCLFLFLLSLLTICSTGTLVGFSYDARSKTETLSPTETISFLTRNKLFPSQIRVFVADTRVLSSLSNTGVSVDLYLNESLVENFINSNSSATSWLKTNLVAFLPHVNIKSIIVSSSSNDLSMLSSTLKSVHSILRSFRLDTKVKVSVIFPVSFVEDLNTRHEQELHRIFNFIKKVRSFVIVEASVDGELSMGDRFVLSIIKRATHAASIVPCNDVPMVLTIKSPAVPSAIEVAEFTDKVSKSLDNSGITDQIVGLYAEISFMENFAQKELEREKEQIFPSSHRELLNNFHLKTTLHDAINPPTTIFPTTPISITPVTIPPDTPTPTIVTIPSTNPVTITPATPIPIPTTTPITVPSTNPANSPVPITNPVTTPISVPSAPPITNPVTTYPAPAGNIPVTTPVTNPVPPPATVNGPAIPGQSWCVAKTGAQETAIQSALDYACGIGGADCSLIQQGGSCYNPNTLQNHASYAFNSYYQKNPVPSSCDFGGTAAIVSTNPSTGSCIYSSSSSSSSSSVPSPSTPTPTPTTASSSSTSPPPPSGTGVSGSGTPPTVLNTSNPASGSTTVFGSESPPGVNNSASTSAGSQPFVGCIILVTSFVTGKIILDI